jgi:hypothetical protein
VCEGKPHLVFGLYHMCSTKSLQGVADRQKLAGKEVFWQRVNTCHDKDEQALGLGLGKERESFCLGLRLDGDEERLSAVDRASWRRDFMATRLGRSAPAKRCNKMCVCRHGNRASTAHPTSTRVWYG